MSAAEKTEYPEDLKRLSRQIAQNAARLEKLVALGAPKIIVESDRKLLAERIARFPVFDPGEVKE